MGVHPHCHPNTHMASFGAGCRRLPKGAPHIKLQRDTELSVISRVRTGVLCCCSKPSYSLFSTFCTHEIGRMNGLIVGSLNSCHGQWDC